MVLAVLIKDENDWVKKKYMHHEVEGAGW